MKVLTILLALLVAFKDIRALPTCSGSVESGWIYLNSSTAIEPQSMSTTTFTQFSETSLRFTMTVSSKQSSAIEPTIETGTSSVSSMATTMTTTPSKLFTITLSSTASVSLSASIPMMPTETLSYSMMPTALSSGSMVSTVTVSSHVMSTATRSPSMASSLMSLPMSRHAMMTTVSQLTVSMTTPSHSMMAMPSSVHISITSASTHLTTQASLPLSTPSHSMMPSTVLTSSNTNSASYLIPITTLSMSENLTKSHLNKTFTVTTSMITTTMMPQSIRSVSSHSTLSLATTSLSMTSMSTASQLLILSHTLSTTINQQPTSSNTSRVHSTVTPPPSQDQPTEFPLFTSTVFLLAAGAVGTALLLGLILITCVLVICRIRKRRWCWCSCCRTFPKIEGPVISVCYRGSSCHGDRESYFIHTSDIGPTSFYTRPGEDDANTEFTAAFYTPATSNHSGVKSVNRMTSLDKEKPVRNVKFRSLERDYYPFSQQQQKRVKDEEEEEEEGKDNMHILELENLEKLLDNALVKFETTTL